MNDSRNSSLYYFVRQVTYSLLFLSYSSVLSTYSLHVQSLFLHLITLRHTTLGRTPLDEGSARRRDLYLTTHNTHDRHSCPQRDSNPQSLQGSSRRPRRLRPCGHWVRLAFSLPGQIFSNTYADSSTYALPCGSVTKFHTHTKQRMNLSVLAIG